MLHRKIISSYLSRAVNSGYIFSRRVSILRSNEALPYLRRLLTDKKPGTFSYDVYPRTIEFRGWDKTETSL